MIGVAEKKIRNAEKDERQEVRESSLMTERVTERDAFIGGK